MTETPSSWTDAKTYKENWEKLDKLDSGSQGEVYRAQRSSDGKIGFLKIIKSKNDAERRARFFREATAYDSFGIDGVPRLIESNAHRHTDDSVTPFIVTEFIAGITLRDWRELQESVPIDVAVMITSCLLTILDACHAQGCVHRDVKPDNIMLEDGDPSRVWLLDFGISYHNLTEIDFRTEDWQEMGNRFLRLPELSAGSLSKQDPKSDICFAAGIFFYLLTGDHPDSLVDGEMRLPHQRFDALEKLRQVAAHRLQRLLAFFDDAFAVRLMDRFPTVHTMHERMQWTMQDEPLGSSMDDDINALREALDTAANHRLNTTIKKIGLGLGMVQEISNQVNHSIDDHFTTSQTAYSVTGEGGQNTLFWSRQGATDRFLSVTYKVIPAGDELLFLMEGDTVYRTDLEKPDYGPAFNTAVKTWLAAKLRAAYKNPATPST